MHKDNEKGSLASNQGKVLESTVESTFKSKGFEILMYRDWERNKNKYSDNLLLKNCPFVNIYQHPGNTEFLLKSAKYNCEIRIECKWQQSSGSVDEKFPYLYLNCIDAMPEKHIVIIVDGGGARSGAVEWLKNAAANKKYTNKENQDKLVEVFSLTEFIQWANKNFR
ncbi:MAG: 4-diphosphocytidyl-2C-methyl-D-erythritol kinase [Spirochaetales bacterium]|jgi:hypothetical protein|nr:4-diphosphocytidyl-2C-methyl-D-erythritol kinase [Spirochaetales bacterium]